MHHCHFPTDLGLKEAEAAVVAGERLDVRIDPGTVQVSAEQPQHAGLRLDLREQTGIGGDAVADEAGPQRLTAAALVDEKHGPLVARLASFDRGDFRGVVTLLVVIRLDPAARFLHHVSVHRVADIDLRFLADGAGRHPLIADVFHVAQHRPLHHLKDHDNAFLDPHRLRIDVDELAAAVERANILLDRGRIEDLAGPRDEFGKLRDVGGMVALDPHLNDAIRFIHRGGGDDGCHSGRNGHPGRGGDRGRRQLTSDCRHLTSGCGHLTSGCGQLGLCGGQPRTSRQPNRQPSGHPRDCQRTLAHAVQRTPPSSRKEPAGGRVRRKHAG